MELEKENKNYHQPDAYKSTNDNVKAADNSGAPEALNILDLNDDCLEIIVKKLDVRSQVRMSLSCTRFSGILEICAKLQHKRISFEDFAKMTLREFREFFLVVGNSVESITGQLPYQYTERVIELIAANCPNAKRIDLINTIIHTNSLIELCENLKNVTELKLRNCELNDNAFMNLHKLTKLEVLGLPDNQKITGKYLSQLSKLRELDLERCWSFEKPHFIEIIKSIKNLKMINIEGCIFGCALEEMEKHCFKLESLRLSLLVIPSDSVIRLPALKRLELTAHKAYSIKSLFRALSEPDSQLEYLYIRASMCGDLQRAIPLTQHKTLKHLRFPNNYYLTDDSLNRFGALEQLEEVDLRGSICITNAGLLELVRLCPKLRRVNIMRCPNINDEFVFNVIQLLQQRQQSLPANHKMEPVVFDVFCTYISEDIMNQPSCWDALSLIKLSFDCVLTEEYDYLDARNYDELNEDSDPESELKLNFITDLLYGGGVVIGSGLS